MNCLKCKKEILITKIDKDGFGWLMTGEHEKIKHDGKTEYVKCPFCKAINEYSEIKPIKKDILTYAFTKYTEPS